MLNVLRAWWRGEKTNASRACTNTHTHTEQTMPSPPPRRYVFFTDSGVCVCVRHCARAPRVPYARALSKRTAHRIIRIKLARNIRIRTCGACGVHVRVYVIKYLCLADN